MQFFSHFLEVSYINDIVKNIIDNLSYNNNFYLIYINLLFAFVKKDKELLRIFFNKISHILFYKYNFY